MLKPKTSSPLTVGILRCKACGASDPGPRDLCPVCYSGNLATVEVPGTGTLVATTFVRRPPAKFKADGVYGIAIVQLDAGVRIVGRVEEMPDAWRPGERVGVITKRNGYNVFGRVPA